ncbi:hypothetical protein [Variovorax rhizosphaerae]|uniref:Holo-[acyl-carrier-protein] synthase n=1 Tax=Variovorax rhizosphaerae TaxID=1836200 RepID=A0ABU8WIF8_9BURK
MPSATRHDFMSNLLLGVDWVDVHAIEDSLGEFGGRFVHRIFSAHEVECSNGSPERLAADVAGKKALTQALEHGELGIDWRNIEVRSDATALPGMRLAGKVAARARGLGTHDIAVSLSHEGNWALATDIAQVGPEELADTG